MADVVPLLDAHGFEQKPRSVHEFRRFKGDVIQTLGFDARMDRDLDEYRFTMNALVHAQTAENTSGVQRCTRASAFRLA